jgi:hypothetical protein
MRYKTLLSLLVIALLFFAIYSPVVEASIIFGPEKFSRTTGSPNVYNRNFSIGSPQGNYTLYVKNGDLIINGSNDISNASSSSEVWFNGEGIFGPDDFKKMGGLLKKRVSAGTANQLKVEMRSKPGSQVYVWVEDETPDIVILSPWQDTVSNAPITVFGYVTDHTISSVTFNYNGNNFDVSVTDGNFSAEVNLTRANNITISAVDRTGTLRSTTLLLDGDYLTAQAELAMGFDPLNPDSDSSLTSANEAGNGIPDGYEILGGQDANNMRLPAFIKAEVHADPLKDDSDDDGLYDYFEVMKLGPYADPSEADHDNNNVSDALEDPDKDNLTNIDEQSYGTDPLLADMDNDGLSDGYEVKDSHTNPLLKDSDNDGLQDDSELKLGTDPSNPDTNNNGILDGNESYTSSLANETLGISISVVGKGDLGKELTIRRVMSEHYTNVSALVSPLVDVSVNGSIDYAHITMEYDPSLNPANLSLCYYDESRGLYVPVESHVDAANYTVSANVTHLSDWGIFEVKNLMALYKMASEFNNEPYNGTQSSYPQPGDTLFVPYNSTLIMKYLGGTAGYNNKFGLWSPIRKQYGTGHGTTPGTSFNLGNYTRGTELVFYIDNGVGNTWLSGPGSRNPDGVAHAYIKPITNDTWLLGWEDLYGGGDKDYDDVVLNLTFTRSAMLDTDGDGLLDDVETHGYMDAIGRYYGPTDPNNPDSDNDGLDDGEEVGELSSNALCGSYYDLYSDPNNVDTDNDGLGDFDEIAIYGSDPYGGDTDHDGLLDGLEANDIGSDPASGDTDGDGYPDLFEYAYSDLNPSVPGFLPSEVKFDPCVPDMAPEKRALEFSVGALSGEYYAEDHGNLYYLSGWMAAGFIPVVSDVADVRDFFASVILKEDASAIALNGVVVLIDAASYLGLFTVIGAIPGYLASVGSTELTIGLKFLGHHAHLFGEVFGMVMGYVKLAKDVKIEVKAAKSLLTKAGVDAETLYIDLLAKGVKDDQFAAWAGKIASRDAANKVKGLLDNGNTVRDVDYVMQKCKKFDDVEVLWGEHRQFYGFPDVVYWLEKGNKNFGDVHIDVRHISGTYPGYGVTGFWPTGHSNVRPGHSTPDKMNIEDVHQMISESIEQSRDFKIEDGKYVFEWTLENEQFGIKKIRTIVAPDGKIITSYPLDGSAVLIYSDKYKKVIHAV